MSTLPHLEHELVRAARRRRRRPWLRRRTVVLALFSAIVLAGGATAATGLLDREIHRGMSFTQGPYTIEREDRSGSLCLNLRYTGHLPTYGCGDTPTVEEPFGLLIADSSARDPDDQSPERLFYGIVHGDIARVSVLRKDGRQYRARTLERPGLPGRFFTLTTPRGGRIEVVGYDLAGHEVGRIGRLIGPRTPIRSQDDARAQGDPSGFAPTADMPDDFSYRGGTIPRDEAARRGLACVQNRDEVVCTDQPAERR